MALKKVLSTKVSEHNYMKMQEFLGTYNKMTGENLTMSLLIWTAVKYFVNNTMKSWK